MDSTEQDSQGAASGRRSLGARLSSFLTPAPRQVQAAPENPLTDAQQRKAILGLDTRERRIGYVGAALAGAIALIATVPYIANPKTKVTVAAEGKKTCPVNFHYQEAAKNCIGAYPRSHWIDELILFGVLALAILVTVKIGRRGAVGFAALIAGLGFESLGGLLLGVPFIAGGGWLLIRAWRVQRYGSPTATRANPVSQPAPARAERAKAATKKTKAPQRTGPEASKRYTPKAPKRKRPAPSPEVS